MYVIKTIIYRKKLLEVMKDIFFVRDDEEIDVFREFLMLCIN